MKTFRATNGGKFFFITTVFFFLGFIPIAGEGSGLTNKTTESDNLSSHEGTHADKNFCPGKDDNGSILDRTQFNNFYWPGKNTITTDLTTGTGARSASPAVIEIWSNTITGADPGLTSPYNAGDVADPNVTVSGIKRGSGINGATAANRYNASNWSTTSLDANDYFEFTLAPNSGYEINLASFVYTGQLSSGTAAVSFRSSLDGYSTNIGLPTTAGTSIDLSGLDYQGLACPLTFRFYAYSLAAPSTTFSINDFIFNGTVTTISSRLTISNAGTTPAGNIELGNTSVILSGFTITSNTAQTLSSVTITTGGNATAADINNVRILHDIDADGVIDANETTSVSGAGISLAAAMFFNLAGQSFSCSRNYLVVADVLHSATIGHNISASISTTTSVNSTVLNRYGNAIGNPQTIAYTTATSDYFKTNTATGNWNAAASWQSSHNGINWYSASAPPASGASKIDILSGHVISITTSGVSMTNTFVKNGATLAVAVDASYSIGGTGTQLTIENGGTLSVNFASASIPLITGTGGRLVKAGGKVWIGPLLSDGASIGNVYANAVNSKFIYEDASIFEWANPLTMFSNTGDEIYFQTVNFTDLPIFKISVTPGNHFAGAGANVFNCIWEANANCGFTGAGTKTIRGGFRGNATITQNGGALILPTGSAVLDGTITMNIVSSGLRLTNGARVPAGANVKITSNPEDQTINKQGGSLLVHGTLDITDLQIANSSGDVTVASNGKLTTSNIQGFSGTGASIASGTINLLNGSTVELNRLGNQVIQLSPDPGYKNLVLSGSGIKKPTSAFNPAGTITIRDNVIFDCTDHNVGDGGTGLAMLNNSSLIVSTTGVQPSMASLPYNLASGTIKFYGSATTSQNIRSESYFNIDVYGTNVKNSAGNIFMKDQGKFVVKSSAVFEMSDNSIVGLSGSQTLIVESGGIFKCAVQPGFMGPAAFPNSPAVRDNIEVVTLQPNSTINYSRAFPEQLSGDQQITNSISYQNLVISGTGVKTAPDGTLSIQGHLIKTGPSVFAHNNGTVLFNGAAAQTFSNNSGYAMQFHNVTNGNTIEGLTINSDSFAVGGELLLSAMSKFNLGTGNVILRSTSSRTANVAPITTASIHYPGPGRFIVERYIKHSGKWQFLATPTVGQTVAQSWQEGSSSFPGFGTHITSPQFPAGGFDAYSISPSMKSFDNVSDTWIGIANTGIPVTNPKGYMLFVRGDRTTALSSGTAVPTALRTTGKICQPNIPADLPPVINIPANKYESLGNPYVSPISISSLISTAFTNLEAAVTVWDPSRYGYYGVGGYQTISYADPKPIPGGTDLYPSGVDFTDIQSGQAFFVKALGAAGSVTFPENVKSSQGRLVNFGPGKANMSDDLEGSVGATNRLRNRQFFRTSLLTASGIIADGNSVVFDKDFENALDQYDASKLYNGAESFGIQRDGRWLAVEARAPLRRRDTIFYAMHNLRPQDYQLLFEPQNMHDLHVDVFLVDNYLGHRTPLKLTENNLVNITVNGDAASASSNRFYVVFVTGKKFRPLPISDPTYLKQSELATLPDKVGKTSSIFVYPNPVVDKQVDLQLKNIPNGHYRLDLYSLERQLVFSKMVVVRDDEETKKLYLPASLSAGKYQLMMIASQKVYKNIPLIIR